MFVIKSITWSSDNQLVYCTNSDVDWLNAQVCQFKRKKDEAFPEYSLAQHLGTFITLGTILHDMSSCKQFWKYKNNWNIKMFLEH